MTETPETRKARILTVDDDRTTLAMLAIAIRKAGYDIVQASCAEEALDRIAENQPDLAVLDISMPGMSGIELARRLRDETAIPFMFLSSHIGSDRVRRFAAQGAVGYLRKPVDFTQVVSMIEAGLARAHALKQFRQSDIRLQDRRESHGQRQADLIGRYAELTELEIRLQQAQQLSEPVANTTGRAHAEIEMLGGTIDRLCRILDAYRRTNASPALDRQARTELRAIRARLARSVVVRDAAALLNDCREAKRRVRGIMRELKDVSLADGSDPSRHCDLHALLDSALETARYRNGRTATVRKNYNGPLPMDRLPARLGHAFTAIFFNAIEAAGRHEQPEIVVRTGIARQRLWVEISDNGCGIAPENRELIFHPFYTTKPPGVGMGLGLTIARDILHTLGGDIDVTSEMGKGSTFRITLPQPPSQAGA